MAAQEIRLTQLNTPMAQDGVGGRRAEVHIGQHKFQRRQLPTEAKPKEETQATRTGVRAQTILKPQRGLWPLFFIPSVVHFLSALPVPFQPPLTVRIEMSSQS